MHHVCQKFVDQLGGSHDSDAIRRAMANVAAAFNLHADALKSPCDFTASAYELFTGMVEFGLARGLAKIRTVTDVRMRRIMRCATWPTARPRQKPGSNGTTMAAAGYLEISNEVCLRLRSLRELKGPVLWHLWCMPPPDNGPVFLTGRRG